MNLRVITVKGADAALNEAAVGDFRASHRCGSDTTGRSHLGGS